MREEAREEARGESVPRTEEEPRFSFLCRAPLLCLWQCFAASVRRLLSHALCFCGPAALTLRLLVLCALLWLGDAAAWAGGRLVSRLIYVAT